MCSNRKRKKKKQKKRPTPCYCFATFILLDLFFPSSPSNINNQKKMENAEEGRDHLVIHLLAKTLTYFFLIFTLPPPNNKTNDENGIHLYFPSSFCRDTTLLSFSVIRPLPPPPTKRLFLGLPLLIYLCLSYSH